MYTNRRQLLETALVAAAATVAQSRSRAAAPSREDRKLGIPGPYPGRVIAIEHSGCIVSGTYQPGPVRQMVERGMKELTGAPSAQDAWRSMFQKGDCSLAGHSPEGCASHRRFSKGIVSRRSV